jgi:hypothetical protein
MKLHRIYPIGLYCGPSALISITGFDYPTAIQPMINECKGAYPDNKVRVMTCTLITEVLNRLGYNAIPVPHVDTYRYRLHNFHVNNNEITLILVTNHYVVMQDNMVFDNHTPNGCHRDYHRSYRKMVKHAWYIREKSGV